MENQQQNIEQLLIEGKNIQIKPQGYSMYPVLVPGRDEAIVEPVGERKLRRGDVVLYRRMSLEEKGILVLHRIWKVSGNEYYMVGDNQKEIEGPLQAEQMKGVMAGLIRKGKYISCENPWYRLLTEGWLLLRPFRPGISKVAATLKKCVFGHGN